MALKKKLRGTGVAVVTPFTTSGKVDFAGLTKVVRHLIKGKVEYLVALGTTGESVTLNPQEKEDVTNCIIQENEGKLPIVLGIGGNDTRATVEILEHTNLNKIDAILSVSPYYNKPSQEGLYLHFKTFASHTDKPIILYNVPGRTSSNIKPITILRLEKVCQNIIGVKEASGNLEQVMEIIQKSSNDFLVISGDDNITLPLLACGADGVISVVANACPFVFSEMVRAGLNGEFAKARRLHFKTFELTRQLFADGSPGGVKEALHALGICHPFLRLPLVRPEAEIRKKIRRELRLLKG